MAKAKASESELRRFFRQAASEEKRRDPIGYRLAEHDAKHAEERRAAQQAGVLAGMLRDHASGKRRLGAYALRVVTSAHERAVAVREGRAVPVAEREDFVSAQAPSVTRVRRGAVPRSTW